MKKICFILTHNQKNKQVLRQAPNEKIMLTYFVANVLISKSKVRMLWRTSIHPKYCAKHTANLDIWKECHHKINSN